MTGTTLLEFTGSGDSVHISVFPASLASFRCVESTDISLSLQDA
jgi:hypothetical protein